MKTRFFGLTALVAGVLGFSSCQKTNEVVAPVDEKVTVSYEAYFQEADGTLSPYTSSLRAVTGNEANKATVTGDGEYFHNDDVTLKVVANEPYTLHELYEKSEKGGFTKAKGKVDGKEKTLNFKVVEDMTFIAVFSNVNAEERGYQNLKVDGKDKDFTLNLEGKTEQSKDMLAVGEEVAPIKTGEGVITGYTVVNGAFKAWDQVGPTPASDWLKVSFDKTEGKLSLVAQPFNEKKPARTTKVKVGKDGIKTDKSAWVEITVSQSSYYVGDDEVNKDSDYVDDKGGKVNFKESLDVVFNPKGETKDLSAQDETFKKPIYVLVPTYKDGELLPKDQWEKKRITVEFGDPNQPWLKKNGTEYTAPGNDGKEERKDAVKVSFKLGNKEVNSTIVNISQKPITHVIDVEIQ